jgi:hypothetical protein
MPCPPSIDPLLSGLAASDPAADLGDRNCLSHEVIVLARLAGAGEVGRAGANETMIDAIALQVHQFAARRV